MEDKYLWLEDVLDEKNLEWVRGQNKHTTETFSKEPGFEQTVQDILKILESKDKIPYVHFIDDQYIYNVWTDEKHAQGLVRRSKLDDYKDSKEKWETVLDLDLLSEVDNQKWVYHGLEISPNHERALVFLSPGGSDADICREFDLKTKAFVKGGFELPVSKGGAGWINNDEIFLSRNFGDDSVTASGYPRTIRNWKRGETLENAIVTFEIEKSDMYINHSIYHHNGKSRMVFEKWVDFYSGEIFVFNNGAFQLLDLPKVMRTLQYNLDYLYIELKEEWNEFSSGDLLAYHFESGKTHLVYRTMANSSISTGGLIEDGLLLVVDTDVKGNLLYLKNNQDSWVAERIELPKNGSINHLVTGTDTNDFFVAYHSFDTPASYFYGVKNKIKSLVKKQPTFFDYENIEVSQHFVKSLDGTMVPYFVAHKKGLVYDGTNPTILYGYGGFQVTLQPYFDNVLGVAWLEKGGVYVLSNIRGGGEYGPSWHQSALKDKRDRAYQDFFAVAEDLFLMKITSPEHLGAQGGSNGGLLMGVCYTQRPDLFKAINCGVPLLDMHRYHKLLAGHSWIAEYGNPDDERDGKYIRALSPYHRIDESQKNYPIIFLNTSTKDDRVHPGHARKFAAKLAEYGHQYFYHENINGGHAGSSNLKELAFIEALDYAFFWKYLK